MRDEGKSEKREKRKENSSIITDDYNNNNDENTHLVPVREVLLQLRGGRRHAVHNLHHDTQDVGVVTIIYVCMYDVIKRDIVLVYSSIDRGIGYS
jgi:hypothetical protein